MDQSTRISRCLIRDISSSTGSRRYSCKCDNCKVYKSNHYKNSLKTRESQKKRHEIWLNKNKEYAKKYASEKRLIKKELDVIVCKKCGDRIQTKDRTMGKMYCTKCSVEQSKISTKNRATRLHSLFIRTKEKLGCSICNYNSYGGALDLHHIDPSSKEIRLTATHVFSQTEKVFNELSKCILVCSNCHRELHHRMRLNKDEYQLYIKKYEKDINKMIELISKIAQNGDVY